MQIVLKKTEELIPYDNNPRNNEEAVPYVAESIKQFGFKVPIVLDKDGVIVSGHTRLKAAKSLGLSEVPCIIADDLNEEQIKAFRLADNKVAELASWDIEKLDVEIADLAEIGDIDMSALGFVIDNNAIDIDSFFEDAEQKVKEPKKIQCPHCGEWFEQ